MCVYVSRKQRWKERARWTGWRAFSLFEITNRMRLNTDLFNLVLTFLCLRSFLTLTLCLLEPHSHFTQLLCLSMSVFYRVCLLTSSLYYSSLKSNKSQVLTSETTFLSSCENSTVCVCGLAPSSRFFYVCGCLRDTDKGPPHHLNGEHFRKRYKECGVS